MSCGVGGRLGSDLAWLWLWCRPAAVALISTLVWELLYAMGAALKSARARARAHTHTQKTIDNDFRAFISETSE